MKLLRKSSGGAVYRPLIRCALTVVCLAAVVRVSSSEEAEDFSKYPPAKAAFLKDYFWTWGDNILEDDGTAIMSIKNAEQKGGGWSSRQPWIHGVFSAMIKMPKAPSCGVVSAFYLTSEWNMSWPTDLHDEIDFEILGDENSGELQLQTNYFVGGKGGHEERLRLWFDPTVDYHEYKFQVNKEAVRWYVDGILVREITAETDGGLPKTSMFVVASIWDGAWWVPCTWGREQRVMDYSKAPFSIYFTNVTMQACYWRQQATKDPPECANPNNVYAWDERPKEKDMNVLRHLQQHYVIYSYETWNTSTGPRMPEAPEERTALQMFDLSSGGDMLRGSTGKTVEDESS